MLIVTGPDWPVRVPPQKLGLNEREDVMSDLKNSVALVASVGEHMGAALAESDKAFAPALQHAAEAGFDLSMIATEEGHAALQKGVIIGWQNADFFAEYQRVKGDVPIKGRVFDARTRRWNTVEKPKRAWQTQVPGKMRTVRGYLEAAFGSEDAKDAKGAKGARAPGWKADPLTAMCERVQKDMNTLVSAGTGTAKSAFWKNFVGDTNEARRALANALKALEALK